MSNLVSRVCGHLKYVKQAGQLERTGREGSPSTLKNLVRLQQSRTVSRRNHLERKILLHGYDEQRGVPDMVKFTVLEKRQLLT